MTPVKQTKFHNESQNGNCMAAALASLLDLPIQNVPAFEQMQDSWKRSLIEWLSDLGYTIKTQEIAPDGFAIATGMSPRDIYHAVIVLDGQWAHDPHPSNDFLRSINKFWVVTKKPQSNA